jgi:cytochrome oxidase Cu insertion factor (SCO1/SenC/PrrC family)
MKVGLSLSRCLRDIVEGKVLFEDVLVVIARTDVDPNDDNHWQQIFEGYLYGGMSNPEWAGMEDEEENLRHVLKQLHKHGKLHQPRQYGAHPARMPYYWLDCVVPENEHNPAQQKAWDNYKMITGLS